LQAETAIGPDISAGVLGKENPFCHLTGGEPDVIHIGEKLQLRSDVGIQSVTEDERAGVHKVGLPFGFAAPKIRHEAIALLKIHRRTGEIETLVNIKAERPANEKRPIQNRIEPSGGAILWIVVSAGIKDRDFVPEPVLVDRKLERGHLRVDLDSMPGNSIQAILAKHLVKRVCDIEPADVSVASPAEVLGLHVMILHFPDRFWPNDETVLIVMAIRAIKIGVKTEFRSVALGEKILPKNIRDQNLLIARIEPIQVRVSILLAHVEGDEVVLPAVVVVVAEDARAEVGVIENEAAKIAHERLNTEARGDEVIIVRQIVDMDFDERLLDRIKILVAGRVAQARIGIEHAGFLDVGVVVVVDAEKTKGPLHRFESGLALEKVDPDRDIVREGELFAPAKKFGAARPRAAYSARRRQATRFELKEIAHREVEKDVLPDDGRVAFECALQIGMPKFQRSALIGRFRGGIGVAFPATEADKPAIRHRFGAGQKILFLLGIFPVFQLRPLGHDFAHTFARQFERSRQDFAAISRQWRNDGREQTRWLDTLKFVRRTGIRVELRRRSRGRDLGKGQVQTYQTLPVRRLAFVSSLDVGR